MLLDQGLKVIFPTLRIDGYTGMLFSFLGHEDTQYANQYSHHKFLRIQIGMEEKEVISILGTPLSRWQPYKNTNYQNKTHFVGFEYSQSPSFTDYRLRQIYFDHGKVTEIIGYYYVD